MNGSSGDMHFSPRGVSSLGIDAIIEDSSLLKEHDICSITSPHLAKLGEEACRDRHGRHKMPKQRQIQSTVPKIDGSAFAEMP